MRWKKWSSAHITSVTRATNVQDCTSVKSTCVPTDKRESLKEEEKKRKHVLHADDVVQTSGRASVTTRKEKG